MLILKYSGSEWSFEEIPFPDADISRWTSGEANEFLGKLGLALIDKDGILRDMDYAISNRIPCLELRHSAAELNRKELISKTGKWRSCGGKNPFLASAQHEIRRPQQSCRRIGLGQDLRGIAGSEYPVCHIASAAHDYAADENWKRIQG